MSDHINIASFGNRNSRSRRSPTRHAGSVLIAVLVCLGVVVAILGTMLQGTLRARRQLHVERDLRQTELMLQAGTDRAIVRLTNEPSYRGETWDLPADSIIGRRDGQVTIEVSPNAANEPWHVRVLAEYGPGDPWSIRRSRTFRVPQNKDQFTTETLRH